MLLHYVKGFVAVWTMIFSEVLFGCQPKEEKNSALRILLPLPPVTLNPRLTIDATGQRLNALMFRGLTRLDADLRPQPDLADRWETQRSGKIWNFRIREGLKDHAELPITPQKVAECLENYRVGNPPSIMRASFPFWKTTAVRGSWVSLELEKPSPFMDRDVSLLRYFTLEGIRSPCSNPENSHVVIGSGPFKPEKWELAPESSLTLLPASPGELPIRFLFVQDENTKALKMLRGEVDVMQNALALTKTRWLQQAYPDRIRVLQREGVPVSYMAFNLRDPILGKREVRQAIAESIDREKIVREKLMGFCTLAGSLLSPRLPESLPFSIPHNPAHAEHLLDLAGYPRKKDGLRLSLHYKSTPVREGYELAIMFQEMLKKIGIKLIIDIVEPAVFTHSIKKGLFQLYSSRWVGIADSSILFRTLRSGEPDNRVRYTDSEMDQILDQAITESDLSKRIPMVRAVQTKMSQDLPYFPLWYWNTALIIQKDLRGLEAHEISLSGGLEPLTRLRY